jgi:hypothetical protein
MTLVPDSWEDPREIPLTVLADEAARPESGPAGTVSAAELAGHNQAAGPLPGPA